MALNDIAKQLEVVNKELRSHQETKTEVRDVLIRRVLHTHTRATNNNNNKAKLTINGVHYYSNHESSLNQ